MSVSAFRLDHIGIAVSSIDQAVGVYEALGLKETRRELVGSQAVRTAFLPIGDTRLELLEPVGPDSPVAKFLAKRGPGIHHVCFAVPDLEGIAATADVRYGRMPAARWQRALFRACKERILRR